MLNKPFKTTQPLVKMQLKKRLTLQAAHHVGDSMELIVDLNNSLQTTANQTVAQIWIEAHDFSTNDVLFASKCWTLVRHCASNHHSFEHTAGANRARQRCLQRNMILPAKSTPKIRRSTCPYLHAYFAHLSFLKGLHQEGQIKQESNKPKQTKHYYSWT